ncbi:MULTISPECIES: serine hydrolase domain-containing protein [Mesorhizobium]|uniref:Beta-lactamase n=1 Tax=Mesorhizobium opportunistum (strain LMG 24607 / HAMBI 3007 / WSM2075) TaxID=536019 RepID=F7YBT0_MESOW|nr:MULTISPECIES: serine hydrolase domain-containing protein [Mesorhizobium]AEH88904.1 beta-lactamase [Mesorhizobium opportunistum WSM2075]MCA0033586.1 beta-lactamase family protein [Mesorhizobium sp. B263B2A]
MSETTISAPLDGSFGGRVDQVVDRAIEDGRIVGAMILVARRGEILYSRAAGLADRETNKPMTADAIFRLSSVTKPVVATAALALVEADVIGLDDPISKYIPEFRPKLADGSEPVITIRQLLTHSAGLSYGFRQPADGPYHRAGVSDGLDQPGLSMADNLDRIASLPLSYVPGTGWGYSVAMDVLGEVMARATGVSLPELVDRLVVQPLGMHDASFAVRDRSRLVTPYADGQGKAVAMGSYHRVPFADGFIAFSPGRVFDHASFASGGTGMNGTASDVLKLLEALRSGGKPVIHPDMAAAMTMDAIPGLETTMPGWGWGLGFGVLRDPLAASTPQTAGTWRWGGVYGHSWFVDPALDLTVVALTNTAIAGMMGAFPDALRDTIYGRQV